jgi:hypothetical protein
MSTPAQPPPPPAASAAAASSDSTSTRPSAQQPLLGGILLKLLKERDFSGVLVDVLHAGADLPFAADASGAVKTIEKAVGGLKSGRLDHVAESVLELVEGGTDGLLGGLGGGLGGLLEGVTDMLSGAGSLDGLLQLAGGAMGGQFAQMLLDSVLQFDQNTARHEETIQQVTGFLEELQRDSQAILLQAGRHEKHVSEETNQLATITRLLRELQEQKISEAGIQQEAAALEQANRQQEQREVDDRLALVAEVEAKLEQVEREVAQKEQEVEEAALALERLVVEEAVLTENAVLDEQGKQLLHDQLAVLEADRAQIKLMLAAAKSALTTLKFDLRKAFRAQVDAERAAASLLLQLQADQAQLKDALAVEQHLNGRLAVLLARQKQLQADIEEETAIMARAEDYTSTTSVDPFGLIRQENVHSRQAEKSAAYLRILLLKSELSNVGREVEYTNGRLAFYSAEKVNITAQMAELNKQREAVNVKAVEAGQKVSELEGARPGLQDAVDARKSDLQSCRREHAGIQEELKLSLLSSEERAARLATLQQRMAGASATLRDKRAAAVPSIADAQAALRASRDAVLTGVGTHFNAATARASAYYDRRTLFREGSLLQHDQQYLKDQQPFHTLHRNALEDQIRTQEDASKEMNNVIATQQAELAKIAICSLAVSVGLTAVGAPTALTALSTVGPALKVLNTLTQQIPQTQQRRSREADNNGDQAAQPDSAAQPKQDAEQEEDEKEAVEKKDSEEHKTYKPRTKPAVAGQ